MAEPSLKFKYTHALEQFEDRLVPVVGQYALLNPAGAVVVGEFLAAQTTPVSKGFDGVVRFDSTKGTGSLIHFDEGAGWGHHILTAGHVTDPSGGDGKLTFEVARGGVRVAVPVPVLKGSDFQVRPLAYLRTTVTDIAVVRLADPEGAIADRSPSRLLVAPFGADMYTIAAKGSSHLGKTIAVAGYGASGDGEEGARPTSRFVQGSWCEKTRGQPD